MSYRSNNPQDQYLQELAQLNQKYGIQEEKPKGISMLGRLAIVAGSGYLGYKLATTLFEPSDKKDR